MSSVGGKKKKKITFNNTHIATMNNDDMPLNVYGLRPGSYITMKVNKHTQQEVCILEQPTQHPIYIFTL